MKTIIKTRRTSALFLAIFVAFSALVLSACGSETKDAYSPEIPCAPEPFFVYDEVGVLDPADEAYLAARNEALFALSGAQIVVVCVRTTGTLDIADYAYQMFNKWGVGSAERNNGVLILLSIDEDDYWVLQGEGLEDTLPSGILKTMNNTHLEPYFAEKQYALGVRALFDALISHMETLYSIDIDTWNGAPGEFSKIQPDETVHEEETSSAAVDTVMIAILIVIVILIVIAVMNNSGGSGGRHRRVYGPTVHIPPHRPTYRGGFYPGKRPGAHPSPRPGSFGGPRPGGFSGGSRPGGFSGGSRPGGFSGGGRSRGGGAGRR